MATCRKDCKHNYHNWYCKKYQERIHESKSPECRGILWHPLDYLENYYNDGKDIDFLIQLVEKHSLDSTSLNIVNQYRIKKTMSDKQRRYLVYHLLNNCYEEEIVESSTCDFCQVED